MVKPYTDALTVVVTLLVTENQTFISVEKSQCKEIVIDS